MNQQEQSQDNKFVELSDFTPTDQSTKRHKGNVLKNISPSPIAFNELQKQCKRDDDVQIIVNRDDEKIVNIEFRCSCGNSKSISFEYDEE